MKLFYTAVLTAGVCGLASTQAHAINDPTDISGIELWLDASNPRGDGTPVTGSYDLGNSNRWFNAADAGVQPSARYRTEPIAPTEAAPAGRGSVTWIENSQIGNKPAFRFDATGNGGAAFAIQKSNGNKLDIRPNTGAAPELTIMTVYRTTGNGNGQAGSALWGIDNGDWDRMFFNTFDFNGGQPGGYDGDGAVGIGTALGNNVRITNAGLTGENRVATVSYKYGDGSTPDNNSFVSFSSAATGTTFTKFTDTTSRQAGVGPGLDGQQDVFAIGWDGDNNYAQADIAEIIVFKRSLNVCEVHSLNVYLSDKYSGDFWGEVPGNTDASSPEYEPCLANLLNKIKAYADGDGTTPPALTPSDYREASVKYVDNGNITKINEKILAKDGDDINSIDDIQAIIREIIEDYADTNGTSYEPTKSIYDAGGILRVTPQNIDRVNAEIAGKTRDEVDTQAEVQAIVDGLADLVIDAAPLTRTIEEGKANTISPNLLGTPAGTVTWSLRGDDAADFNIDPTTGAVTLKSSKVFDDSTPANNALNITLVATDAVNGGASTEYTRDMTLNLVEDPDFDRDGDGLTTRQERAQGVGTNPNLPDTDGDGLNDGEEVSGDPANNVPATDPTKSDTDDDGINDKAEIDGDAANNIPATNPTKKDTDDDGIEDKAEIDGDAANGVPATDPTDPDTDGDGLSDKAEIDASPATDPTDADSDNDGVNDGQELVDTTNPKVPDTDSDGVNDGQEKSDTTDPKNPDTDNDGVNDGQEKIDTTDPKKPDTDNDGVNDGQEKIDTTNPKDPDTDNDGVNDGQEKIDTTDPKDPDTDNDGVNDGQEKIDTTDPKDPDTDNDGVNDGQEKVDTTDPKDPDTDNDGVNDGQEKSDTTDPKDPDSDNDGLNDGQEKSGNTDPLDPDTDGDGVNDDVDSAPNDDTNDSDGDGISNADEVRLGTNPNSDDTDGDGINDNDELSQDPTDASKDSAQRDTDGNGTIDALDPNDDGDSDNTTDEINKDANGKLTTPVRDADGDSIPDYLDPSSDTNDGSGGDSDNDGLSDAQECPNGFPCADGDSDGIPDYMDDDSDNNGINDGDEVNPFNNTDGDKLPDYADPDDDNDTRLDRDEISNTASPASDDTDSDNIPDYKDGDDFNDAGKTDQKGDSDRDGISDAVEFGSGNAPLDTDGDTIPDYMDPDSDNDGILDAIEAKRAASDAAPEAAADLVDTDSDTIPDYLDEDSDGDSIKDSVEAKAHANDPDPTDFASLLNTDSDLLPNFRDLDSDGDGLSDFDECLPACRDNDGDEVPDYLEANVDGSVGEIKTALNGAGSIDLWAAFAALGLVLVRHARRVRHYALAVLAVLPFSGNTQAEEATSGLDDLDVYVGAGLGQSDLEPDVNANSFLTQDDDGGTSWKLFAGWDYNEHFSLEGYYADLAEASYKPKGEISYTMFGLSGLGHYWLSGEPRQQGAWALLGKLGVGRMSNTGSEINFDKQTSTQFTLGAGVEYYLPYALSVRAEYESFDKDASLMSLSLVKRFGPSSRGAHDASANAADQAQAEADAAALAKQAAADKIAAAQALKEGEAKKAALAEAEALRLAAEKAAADKAAADKAAADKAAKADSDGDGVADAQDKCPATAAGLSVDAEGCVTLAEGVDVAVIDISFAVNSADLSAKDRAKLDGFAKALNKAPALKVEVQAHSDWSGPAAYNKKLSQRRAESVAAYLSEQGVAADRMKPVGYGESKPRASNKTPEGRAKNRRVEFVVTER